MGTDLFTTKVTIEVTIQHFGTAAPKQAIDGIVVERIKCPAVKEIIILAAKSDYQLHGNPLSELVDIKM